MSRGIIRRIDNLGRIVIPKEIRKTMKLGLGDLIDIYTNNDDIILRKYSTITLKEELINSFINSVYNNTKNIIFITDRDNIVIGVDKYIKKYRNLGLSQRLIDKLDARKMTIMNNSEDLHLTDELKEYCSYIISPVVNDGDVLGLVILINKEKNIGKQEELLMKITTAMIIDNN